jgi:hypothetical protein
VPSSSTSTSTPGNRLAQPTDIAINLMLRKYGVKLIFCTENIDDTPSGKLPYGLMAEIAQIYTGNLALEVIKGLTTRPTPTRPSKPIPLTTMYHILANPYYMGVVSYQGIHYEGKHPALIEPDTWLALQAVLAAHNHTGEKAMSTCIACAAPSTARPVAVA